MLYNPHHRVPSLDSFAAWLETKDPDEEYRWIDSRNCACAQYAKEREAFEPSGRGMDGILNISPWHELNMLAQHCGTFGSCSSGFGRRWPRNAALCRTCPSRNVRGTHCGRHWGAGIASPGIF